jgi:hypothetical protein
MRVLQIMAGKGNGGAELYSTDVMLSLHQAGIDQSVVMRPSAPRTRELQQAGLRLATNVLKTPLRPLQRARLSTLIAAEKPCGQPHPGQCRQDRGRHRLVRRL